MSGFVVEVKPIRPSLMTLNATPDCWLDEISFSRFASNDTGWLSVSNRYTSACPNLFVASFRIVSVNSMSFVRWL